MAALPTKATTVAERRPLRLAEAGPQPLEPEAPAQSHGTPLALRVLFADAAAKLDSGRVLEALAALDRARAVADSAECSDADRAEVFFRLGCCRLTLGNVSNAASLFTLALDFCDRSPTASDRLRTSILDWRSRCYQRQRDWEAARADVERAFELAHDLGDPRVTAGVCFQASIVAEREKQWLLARFYADEARQLLEEIGDQAALAKVLNNLGGIHFLLGNAPRAIECLQEALDIARERGNDLEIGYALSSLAQVELRCGDANAAAANARLALEWLAFRHDHAAEIGGAELVLARALLEQADHAGAEAAFRRADEIFRGLASPSHSAAAWIAGGDIARGAGDLGRAAELYRAAAESLQDLHF